MKKVVPVLALLAAFILYLTFTAPADAQTGIATDTVTGAGYLEPTPGVNPHGGYSTSTNKCKTCHAVHGATSPDALLRTPRDNACTYCHFNPNFTAKHPYGTDPNLYLNEYENNHAGSHQGSPYKGCVNCHSVHGTDIWSNAADGVTLEKIVRKDPGGTMMGGNSKGALTADATSLNTFCRDCHDGTDRADNPLAACASTTCHPNDATMQVTDAATRGGPSHVMTDSLTNPAGEQVASNATQNCKTCHKGGTGTYADGNSFPHLTDGAQFLKDGHSTATGLDGVCRDCHLWNGGASGVGQTF